jgi:Carboxypeptidase regulatory-like domain
MLRRSLPFLALLILGLAMTWRWIDPTPNGQAKRVQETGQPAEAGAPKTGLDQPLDNASTPERAADRRSNAQQLFQAEVLGEDGKTVWGTAYWLELNEELVQALQSQLTIAAGELRRLGHVQQARFDDGQLALSLPSEHHYFLWVESPGHHPVHYFLDSEPLPDRISLKLCPPFEVEILDQDDGGVMAASVVITREGADAEYPSLGWRERLIRRYFQQSSSPNSQGLAVFDIVPDSRLFVWVKPHGPFGVVTRDQQPPVGRLTLRLESAATLFGRVTDANGTGIEGVFVAAMTKDDRGVRSSVGDTVTDAEGRYRNEQVTVTGEGLLAIAYLDGYESKTAPLPFLRAGQEYPVDFQLEPAKARQIRVQSPDGEALVGLRLEFAHTPYDWVPFAATVDANGIASVKPILLDDTEYCVNVYSAGTRVHLGQLRTGSSDEVLIYVIPGLGRFAGPMPEAPPEMYLELTPLGVGTRTFSVESHVACPWVPAGVTRVQIVDRAGVGSPIHSVMIEPGTQAWPKLDRELPQLSFRLALRNNEKVKVIASGAGYAEQQLGTVAPGLNEWSIPAPGLEVRLVSSARGSWSLGPLCADGLDLDLGELEWPDEGELLVTAVGPDGVGMPRTAVQVFSNEGAWLLDARTGPYGTWITRELRTGAFLVHVSPEAGHGAPLPTQQYSVIIQPGKQTEIRAAFSEPEGLTLIPPRVSAASWSGEARMGGAATRTRSTAAGELVFPRSDASGDWAAWAVSPNRLVAIGAQAVPMQGVHTLALPSEVFVEPQAQAGGTVQLSYGGSLLAQTAVSQTGRLSLRCDLPPGYFLRWTDASGTGPRVPLESVLATRRLPARSDTSLARMRVMDELGRLLPGSIGLFLECRESSLTDVDGELVLQTNCLGTRVRVERAGYHPVEQIAESGQDLVLRQLTGPLIVHTSLGANSVRIVPLFPLSVPLDRSLLDGGAAHRVEFKQVPAGDYRIEWLDDNGKLVSETSAQLDFGSELEIDPL